MDLYKVLFLYVFVCILVVWPIIGICHAQVKPKGRLRGAFGDTGHIHKESPCAVCPRYGRCVPRIQCPAHLRPGSFNPECHLDGAVGICCFTGSAHAAESDLKLRSASSLNVQDLKLAHHQSHQKLAEWMSKAEKLLASRNTIVNVTSPSFAHHLSILTYDKRAQELARGGLLNLFAAQSLKARQAISDDELSLGLTDHTDGPFCPPPPTCPSPPSRYRTIGGECNNPAFPTWGAVNTGYERLLPPDYSDGVWALRSSASGLPLPSPRRVSSSLLLDGSHPSSTHSLMFMQFGQFVAHDTSAGVVFTIGNGSAISCCSNDGEDFLPPELQHWGCTPIVTDVDDDFYGQFRHRCLNFVRTQLAPASDCSVGYAKQMNGATHLPDLSHLYGTTTEKLTALRASGGLLNTFNDYGRELPPLTSRKECLTVNEGAACFESGDHHGNQIISLTVLHILWTREHNRVARALSRLNPDWNEELVFWETRKILQAEFQHIIYNEWLPSLLGRHLIETFGLAPVHGYSSQYDPHSNPTLTAEFSTAAMRFGHSVVDGKIIIPSSKTGDVYETVSIPEVMFQPSRLRLKPYLDRLLIGLTWQPMQRVDPFVTEGVDITVIFLGPCKTIVMPTNGRHRMASFIETGLLDQLLTRYLFHGGNPFGLDLAAINVQRGRDWGVRSYNYYRRLTGQDTFNDFTQFNPNTAQRLASVYDSPEDIDLWIGGLLEEPVEGGLVGSTFAHIIADQFLRLKKGDRYYYEYAPDVNPGAFTLSQLTEIKKVTLSRIICDNKDGIELFSQPPSAFHRADLPGNEPVPCGSPLIPAMDLSRFKQQ